MYHRPAGVTQEEGNTGVYINIHAQETRFVPVRKASVLLPVAGTKANDDIYPIAHDDRTFPPRT